MSEIGKLDKAMAAVAAADGLDWYDSLSLGIEGQGWPRAELAKPFDRLPARAQGAVRQPVWDLSRHSSGLCVRFATDAAAISARWKLGADALAMPHMPATGVSGVDLYARDGDRWQWLGTGRPTAVEASATLCEGLDAGGAGTLREFILYLPLYNSVESVQIGVKAGAKFEKSPPPAGKPIVFYGTSITQGGCASRPGMVYSAILGRRLDRAAINLGFSGNGKCEPEVAALLAELDPSIFVLDALPNLLAEEVYPRTVDFVRTLRAKHPATPVVLVDGRPFANWPLLPHRRQEFAGRSRGYKKAIKQLETEGIGGLHYIAGKTILGRDGEGTVDGSHPTDLGFTRFADKVEPVLRKLLT